MEGLSQEINQVALYSDNFIPKLLKLLILIQNKYIFNTITNPIMIGWIIII